jgi:hypothetical protein
MEPRMESRRASQYFPNRDQRCKRVSPTGCTSIFFPPAKAKPITVAEARMKLRHFISFAIRSSKMCQSLVLMKNEFEKCIMYHSHYLLFGLAHGLPVTVYLPLMKYCLCIISKFFCIWILLQERKVVILCTLGYN